MHALGLILLAALAPVRAENVIDAKTRARLLDRADGLIARLQSRYNDIFIIKRGKELDMSFRSGGRDHTESIVNLADADDLPVRYTQVMTIAMVYPEKPKKILMIGLGGGSISTYLGRFLPEARIDSVEIDRRVIEAAKTYFGVRPTSRMRYIEGDGRAFLERSPGLYDLILLDAYGGGYVPFPLATREFYALVKRRLTPGGAAAFNIHAESKLYPSMLKTIGAVFSNVDLYPTGQGEVIAVAGAGALPDKETLARRTAELQQRYKFRFALPQLLELRADGPQAEDGTILTDAMNPVRK